MMEQHRRQQHGFTLLPTDRRADFDASHERLHANGICAGQYNGGVDKTASAGTPVSSEWFWLGRPYQLVGISGMAASNSYNARANCASNSDDVKHAALKPNSSSTCSPKQTNRANNTDYGEDNEHEAACDEHGADNDLSLSAPMKRARWGATHAIHEYFSDGFPELAERFVRTRASAAQRRFEYNLGSCRFCDAAAAAHGLKKLKTLFRQLDSACGASDQHLVTLRRKEFVAELRKWGWRRGARLQYRQAKSIEQQGGVKSVTTPPASHSSDNQAGAKYGHAQRDNTAACTSKATSDEGRHFSVGAMAGADPISDNSLNSWKQSSTSSLSKQHSVCHDAVEDGRVDMHVVANGAKPVSAGAALSILRCNMSTSGGTDTATSPNVCNRMGPSTSTKQRSQPSETTSPHSAAQGEAPSKSKVDEASLRTVVLPPTDSWWTQKLGVMSRRSTACEFVDRQVLSAQQLKLESGAEVGSHDEMRQQHIGGRQPSLHASQSFDGIARKVSTDTFIEQGSGGTNVNGPSEWRFPSISQLPNNVRSPIVTSPNCKYTTAAWYSYALSRQAVASQRSSALSVLAHRQLAMLPACVSRDKSSPLVTSRQSCQLEETVHDPSLSLRLPLQSSQLEDMTIQEPSSTPSISLSFCVVDDVSDANSEEHSLSGIEDFDSLDHSPRAGTNKEEGRLGRSPSVTKKTKRTVTQIFDDAALIELDTGEHADSGSTNLRPKKKYCGALSFDGDQLEVDK